MSNNWPVVLVAGHRMGDGRENDGVRRLSLRPRDTVRPLPMVMQRADPFK